MNQDATTVPRMTLMQGDTVVSIQSKADLQLLQHKMLYYHIHFHRAMRISFIQILLAKVLADVNISCDLKMSDVSPDCVQRSQTAQQ